MKFWKRLRFYLIGVVIGLFISFFFFKGRGCGWLPSNRVKNKIAESMILRSDSIKCVMDGNHISDEDVFNLFEDGDVLFNESEVQNEPKKYVLEGVRSYDKHSFKLKFTVRDSTSQITEVVSGEKCDCEGKNDSVLRLVKMPDEMLKKVLTQKELSTTSKVKCAIDCYELTDKQVYDLIDKGSIDYHMSLPRQFPHPVYYIRSGNYLLKIEKAKEKTRLLEITGMKNGKFCDC